MIFVLPLVARLCRPLRQSAARAAATLLALAAAAGCHAADKVFCASQGCAWTGTEWSRIQTLSPLPDPPADPSNAHWNDPAAIALGQAFYFDTRFSGNATLLDAIGRPVASARSAKGDPVNVSCATCHDPRRAGTDDTSVPGTVSIGAGTYDVNGQQTANAAYYPLLYWNGRSDSLWSQAIAVNESNVSMNSTRLQDFWVIVSFYADRYNQVFTDSPPLPAAPTTADFPAKGKPGNTAGCQMGSASEPFGDAFDCMTAANQEIVNRVFANWGKAIGAYEATLVSRDAPFDRFVKDGPGSGWISASAENGARLFVGKASCIDCHNSPLFSDGRFHDIAVPQAGEHVPTVVDCQPGSACDCTPGKESKSCAPSGAWAGALKLYGAKTFRRDGPFSDLPAPGPDVGPDGEPCFTTLIGVAPASCTADPDPLLKGAWRTPSLRDVALTAPYMHDGYYQTLTDVVKHYNQGGVPGAGISFTLPVCGTVDGGACADAGAIDPHVAVQIKPLDLTDQEIADLVAFLETLTGASLPSAQTTAPRADAGTPVDAHPAADAHAGADAHPDGHGPMDASPGQ